jgi:hypothetical protein
MFCAPATSRWWALLQVRSGGDGQGVDDAGVDPGHLLWNRFSPGHRHPGGDVQEQLPGLLCKPHGSDQFGVIGVVD